VRLIEQLAELAALDLEVAAAAAELELMAAREAGDPELVRLEQQRAELEGRAVQATQLRRSAELDLEALAERVRHQERALYDGSVRHPADLQRREHELQGLRERRAAQEERVLAAMEAEEAARADLDGAELARGAARDRVEQRRRADQQRRPSLERDRVTAAHRREQVAAEVPAAALRVYQRTAQHRTPAVARILHGTCTGCRLPVPARVLDQARRDELAVCETCERLLLL